MMYLYVCLLYYILVYMMRLHVGICMYKRAFMEAVRAFMEAVRAEEQANLTYL